MALTPEDVVNKRFNPTKFREGYDQDEVDDFLDEVVVELRRLNQENEELRQRLVAADARISELQRSASQAPVAAAAPVAMPVAAAPAPVPAPAAAPAASDLGAQDNGSMDQSNTNNLLQLARRLHEEHVREGMEKRDQLIAEGHATAARLVSDAETQQRTAVEALAAEKAGLERSVEELRIFESEYRDKLRGYIEGQLQELESAAPIAGAETGSAAPVSNAPSYAAPVSNAPSYAAPVTDAPSYAAPVMDAPNYAAPVVDAPPAYTSPLVSDQPVAQTPLQDAPAPSFADFAQAPAPQPAAGSTPPAYAGFPAPQVTPGYPAQQQAEQPAAEQPAQGSQQPEYPAYSQRSTEFPGFGGN
jgi:DivIVA domain-containing protein